MDRLSASAVAHVHDVVNTQLRKPTGHGLVDPQTQSMDLLVARN